MNKVRRQLLTCEPVVKKKINLSSAPTTSVILLAMFHFLLALLAGGFAILLRRERWSVDLTFLLAISAAAIGWSLMERRRWIFPFLVSMLVSLVFLARNEHIFSPGKFRERRQRTGTDWYPVPTTDEFVGGVVWLWGNCIFWLGSLVVLVTVIYLANEWKSFFEGRPPGERRRNLLLVCEITFLALSVPLVYVADFYWPKQALQARENHLADRETERLKSVALHKQNELAKQKHIESLHQELREAIADLRTAAEAGDRDAAKAASEIIVYRDYEFGVGDDILERKRELLQAGDQGLSFLAEEIIAGSIDSWPIIKTLEEFELTPEVRLRVEIARRRHTIAEMYKRLPAYSTNLGWLEANRDAKQIVAWLIDAIGDREHTTAGERIDLARALEEAAEFGEFDARPAIKILQQIVDGDDDQAVKVAAASALAKAKVDREEHWEQRNRDN